MKSVKVFCDMECIFVNDGVKHNTDVQVVNLVLAAGATHRWYLETFPEEYPSLNRKALFPLMW